MKFCTISDINYKMAIINLTVLLILTLMLNDIQGKELHKRLSKREVKAIFNVDNHESIPNYGIVYLAKKNDKIDSTRYKRDLTKEITNKECVFLYLEETTNVLFGKNTKIFMAKSDTSYNTLTFDRAFRSVLGDVKTYQDPENDAALLINEEDNGSVYARGIIRNKVIVPVPQILRQFVNVNSVCRNITDLPINTTLHSLLLASDPANGILNGTLYKLNEELKEQLEDLPAIPHFIFAEQNPDIEFTTKKTVETTSLNPFYNNEKEIFNNSISEFKELYNNQNSSGVPQNLMKPNQSAASPDDSLNNDPNTVYLEILVNVDYETYKLFNYDIKSLAKYMIAFWNGVDLLYRDLKDPKIRLNIAGIVVPENPSATPYIKTHSSVDDVLDIWNTLVAVGEHFSKENNFPNNMYDAIITMSPRKRYDEATVDTTQDMASLGKTCSVKFGKSVAVVKDNGDFQGIYLAANEIANLLNATTKDDDCPAGNIMSRWEWSNYRPRWSKCGAEAIRNYINSPSGQCLRNKPYIIPSRTIASRNKQCNDVENGSHANWVYLSDCNILFCMKDGNYLKYQPVPIEGTHCGNGKICMGGQCVEIDNQISKKT